MLAGARADSHRPAGLDGRRLEAAAARLGLHTG
jgi:hypothetical protein